jgi:hypothetical protein
MNSEELKAQSLLEFPVLFITTIIWAIDGLFSPLLASLWQLSIRVSRRMKLLAHARPNPLSLSGLPAEGNL